MKCLKCIEEGLKSKIYVGASTTTAMADQQYFDENGDYHKHDPNVTKTGYQCSNGHKWIEERRHVCRACEVKEAEIFKQK